MQLVESCRVWRLLPDLNISSMALDAGFIAHDQVGVSRFGSPYNPTLTSISALTAGVCRSVSGANDSQGYHWKNQNGKKPTRCSFHAEECVEVRGFPDNPKIRIETRVRDSHLGLVESLRHF